MPDIGLDPSAQALPGSGPVIVAFSGGSDSVCLLHQVRSTSISRNLLAVHVDHGLDCGSARRARRALELASDMGVHCEIECVKVRRSGSLEANARDARYAALTRHMQPDSVLLTGHHADDLAETMILRLLRGAGPGGLAGIPRQRVFHDGWLARPLLSWDRARILDYLNRHHLDWISDPANDLLAMDRNFIRHEVLPVLKPRFPGAVRAINRSADLNRAAVESFNALARADLSNARRTGHRLHWPSLAGLDRFRRSEAVRRWCLELGHPPPPGPRLEEFLRQVQAGAGDRVPQVQWGDTCLRRWRDYLWLERLERTELSAWCLSWNGEASLQLPGASGQLAMIGRMASSKLALSVCSGKHGEKIALPGHSIHHRVKDLMLDLGIPPWQRALWPRIYNEKRLLAVGDLWLDVQFARDLHTTGRSLDWQTTLFRPRSLPDGQNSGTPSVKLAT